MSEQIEETKEEVTATAKLLLFPREVTKLEWYKDLSNDSKALFWEYYSRCKEDGYAEVTPLIDTTNLKLDNHDNAFVPVMKALSWVNSDGNLVTGYDPDKGMRLCGRFISPNEEPTNKPLANKSKSKPKKSLSPQDEMEITEAFNKFWDRYPRKVAKPVAFQAWIKLKPKVGSKLYNDIMFGVMMHNKQQTWRDAVRDKDLKFIQHPATWLNQKRWEDEVTPALDEEEAQEAKEKRLEELRKNLSL